MALRRITTQDGEVYFVDAKTGQRVKTNLDVIKPNSQLEQFLNKKEIDEIKDNKSNEYYCSECNTKINYEDTICPNCGTDLSEVENTYEFEESVKTGWIIFSIIFTLLFISKSNINQNDIFWNLGYFTPIYLLWAYALRIWPWKKHKMIIEEKRITFIVGNKKKTITDVKRVNIARDGKLIIVEGSSDNGKEMKEFIENKYYDKNSYEKIKSLLQSRK